MAETIASIALFTLGNFAVSWWSGNKAKNERQAFAEEQRVLNEEYQDKIRAYQNRVAKIRAENAQRKYDREMALNALSEGDKNMMAIRKYLDQQERYKEIPIPKPPKKYSSGLISENSNEEYNAMVKSYTTIGGLIVFLVIIAFIFYK